MGSILMTVCVCVCFIWLDMTTPPWCREKVMVYYYYYFYILGLYPQSFITQQTFQRSSSSVPLIHSTHFHTSSTSKTRTVIINERYTPSDEFWNICPRMFETSAQSICAHQNIAYWKHLLPQFVNTIQYNVICLQNVYKIIFYFLKIVDQNTWAQL